MRIRDLLLGALLVVGAAPAVRAEDQLQNPRTGSEPPAMRSDRHSPSSGDPHAREVAREHYARGVALAGKNNYAEALQEFNQAYIVSPEFAVLYNIGECHIALGHPTEAIEALARYLREGGDRIPPARRELVKDQIDMLGALRAPDAATTDGGEGGTAGARETARARVSRGHDLASHNQYGAALKELADAYATDPEFDILYAIGQCHVALGHPLEAIDAFSRYLRDGGDRVPAGRGDLLGAQIVMLESRLAELTIVTLGPPARVLIDGRAQGRAPLPHSVRINAGNYRVSVVPDVGPTVDRNIVVAEAQHLTLTVRLPFLPAGWSPATEARVRATAAAAARAAMAAAIANEAAIVEKTRAASSQQGGSGSSQGGSAH